MRKYKNYPDRKVKFVCGIKEEIRVFHGYAPSDMINSEFLYWLRKMALQNEKRRKETIWMNFEPEMQMELRLENEMQI